MILSLETVKQHIRRVDDYDDTRVLLCLNQAHAIVFDYLKVDEADYGTIGAYNVSLLEAAAILKVALALYDGEDPIDQTVKELLRRQRDPAMA